MPGWAEADAAINIQQWMPSLCNELQRIAVKSVLTDDQFDRFLTTLTAGAAPDFSRLKLAWIWALVALVHKEALLLAYRAVTGSADKSMADYALFAKAASAHGVNLMAYFATLVPGSSGLSDIEHPVESYVLRFSHCEAAMVKAKKLYDSLHVNVPESE